MDNGELVRQLREQFPINTASAASIFNFTRRVAWALRDQGFGLMEKSYGGENEFEYQGTRYSLSRIATQDQHFKILTDAGPGGANGATWVDEGPLPLRPGVSFKPALPPDDASGSTGGSGSAAGLSGEMVTVAQAHLALAEAVVLERVVPLLNAMQAKLDALQAKVDARDAPALPKKIALKDARGFYLCADQNYSQSVPVLANRTERGGWETFDLEPVE